MSLPDERLDAKRFNEFLRLLSSSIVNTAIGVVIGAFIVPQVTRGTSSTLPAYWLMGAGIAYLSGLLTTQLIVSEE